MKSDTNDTKHQGNTKPDAIKPKTSVRSRKWCITLNNYEISDIDTMTQHFSKECQNWIIGKETGEISSIKHLQVYFDYKNARSFTSVKKLFPRAHIEKAKGSLKANFKYCSKDGDYTTNIDLRTFKEKLKDLCLEEYKNVVWHPWQNKILELLKTKPDKRSIHWFWEPTGNRGKSFLCKYIGLTMDVIICEGKKGDIFNQVNTVIESEKIPRVIIIDCPRTCLEYINYTVIEKLKDGFIYSGKYEGGQCIFPNPHVIVFANQPPDMLSVSYDRWNITEL